MLNILDWCPYHGGFCPGEGFLCLHILSVYKSRIPIKVSKNTKNIYLLAIRRGLVWSPNNLVVFLTIVNDSSFAPFCLASPSNYGLFCPIQQISGLIFVWTGLVFLMIWVWWWMVVEQIRILGIGTKTNCLTEANYKIPVEYDNSNPNDD